MQDALLSQKLAFFGNFTLDLLCFVNFVAEAVATTSVDSIVWTSLYFSRQKHYYDMWTTSWIDTNKTSKINFISQIFITRNPSSYNFKQEFECLFNLYIKNAVCSLFSRVFMFIFGWARVLQVPIIFWNRVHSPRITAKIPVFGPLKNRISFSWNKLICF